MDFNLTKWKFSENDIIIAPYDYLLIWCDDDEDQGLLHTNFKISSDGEFIALTNPDGQTGLYFPFYQTFHFEGGKYPGDKKYYKHIAKKLQEQMSLDGFGLGKD